jgi:hypothetical protein
MAVDRRAVTIIRHPRDPGDAGKNGAGPISPKIAQVIFDQELKTGKKPEADAIFKLVDKLNAGLSASWSQPVVPSELRFAIGVILRDAPKTIDRLEALRPMMSDRLGTAYRALLEAATAAQRAGGGTPKPSAQRAPRSHGINQEHREWRSVFHAVEQTLRDAGRRAVGRCAGRPARSKGCKSSTVKE